MRTSRKRAEGLDAVAAARRDLARLIEPEPPRHRLRRVLAGGAAAAVLVALWAVLSRRPQQVETPRPVRVVPDVDGTVLEPTPIGVGRRNGHRTA